MTDFRAITPADVEQTREARTVNPGVAVVNADCMLTYAPDMAAMLEYWDRTDDIVTGYQAVRDGGEKYLPRFVKEPQERYNFRQRCTKMTNVYRDIVESLASKPFETEVSLIVGENETIPQEFADFIENVDGSGNNLTVFAAATFFNGVNSAIDWIFVDAPPLDPTIKNRAEEKARGVRPYWSHVIGRNVREARTAMIDGHETLTYIRIFEPGKPDHVRVFERLDTGSVVWTLYEKRDAWRDIDPQNRTQFHETSSGTVTIGVIPLVPFITGRRDGRTFRLFPAMRDAADLQIELYQQESALKFAKILTAYPMLAGNGISPPKDAAGNVIPLEVGPQTVLYGPRDGNGNAGTWGYVEPSSESLKFLADDNKETIQNLRELGRQPLTAQSGNLTVITTAVAAGKAKTAVQAWAFGLKDALENAFKLTGKFLASPYEPQVNVFTEFDDGSDDSADIAELGEARRARDLSLETYWEELQRRKKLGPDFTAERERERLLQEVPADNGPDTNVDDNPPL